MMSEYGNGSNLAYWEGALMGCQEETHNLEKTVGMGLGESRISSRVRQFAALLDRAKQQEQRIRELEEGLRPFTQEGFQAALGGNVEGDDSPVYGREKSILTLGDFRRAKKLLEKGDE